MILKLIFLIHFILFNPPFHSHKKRKLRMRFLKYFCDLFCPSRLTTKDLGMCFKKVSTVKK